MNNANSIRINTLFLTRALLLDEIHMAFTTLCGTHSQSGAAHIYFTNKSINVRKIC